MSTFKLSAPVFVQLELTERCNHNCYYCYNYFDHSLADMSVDEIKRVLNQLEINKVFSVVLTGGEPLMNRRGFNFAMDCLRDKPVDVYINTNLSLPLKEEDIGRLKNSNFVLVAFPTYREDSFNKTVGKNSYTNVLNNLEKLVSNNVKFGINQVVTRKNRGEIYMTAKFLFEKFNVRSFSATPMVTVRKENLSYELDKEEIINLAEDLLRLEKEIPIKTDMLDCIPPCLFPKKIREHPLTSHECNAGRDMAVISPKGLVRRCTKLEESYGNLFYEDLSVIWQRIAQFKKPRSDLCEYCLAKSGCYGGCEVRVLLQGTDPLVCGSKNPYEGTPYKTMEEDKMYRLSDIRWREEDKLLLIVGDSGSFVIGNQMLLKFMQNLRGRKFTLKDVEKEFEERGERLLNYLYNKELVKNEI